REGARFSTVTGKGFRPRTIDLGRWRYLTATIFILYFVVIVLLPFLVLAWSSLQKFYSAPSWAALSRVSLDSYRAVLHYPQFANAVWNSVVLALGSATTVMLISAGIAWNVLRTKMPGRWVLRNMSSPPLGLSRAGARTRDHGLLSLRRHRRLRHALDHVHRLRDAFSSLWHALQLGLDAADSQGARGIGGDERRFLEHDLPPRRSAVVEARTAG